MYIVQTTIYNDDSQRRRRPVCVIYEYRPTTLCVLRCAAPCNCNVLQLELQAGAEAATEAWCQLSCRCCMQPFSICVPSVGQCASSDRKGGRGEYLVRMQICQSVASYVELLGRSTLPTCLLRIFSESETNKK